MKKLSVLLLACASILPIYGQAGDAEAVKQVERDWIDAQKAADVEKLGKIIGDDWQGLGFDGTKNTKQKFLADVKSGATKVQSIEVGPMDVKLVNGVAIVQGSDTEKSSYKGKDTSGKWAWMDVFVKRDGRWQAVRSQSTLIK